MYRLFKILLTLTPLFFHSCLDVVEEIDLRADNSGTATYTINLSQSKIKLNTLLKLDSLNGYKVPSLYEVEQEIKSAANELKTKKGIKNVFYTIDNNEYVYVFKIDFVSLNDLDKAIKELSYWQKTKWKPYANFYKTDNATITKTIDKLELSERTKGQLKDKKSELTNGTYTFILRNTHEVENVNPNMVKISGSKKAVFYRQNIFDFINRPTQTNIVIEF